MKIRNGFVSNSSSSSFVVFGQKYNEDEMAQMFDDYSIDISKFIDVNMVHDALYMGEFDEELPENFTIALHGEEKECFVGIYESGEYDMSADISPEDFDKFKGNKQIKLYGGEYSC